jgi:hypothetical protein
MKTRTLTIAAIIGSLILPAVSYAALDGLRTLLTSFSGLLGSVRNIVFGLALLFFFWGIAQFILRAGDAKVREDGKKKIFWSVIAMFVLVSIFGIIAWIGYLFGIPTNGQSVGGINSGFPTNGDGTSCDPSQFDCGSIDAPWNP